MFLLQSTTDYYSQKSNSTMGDYKDLDQHYVSLIEQHYPSRQEALLCSYTSMKEFIMRGNYVSTEEMKELIKPLCLLTDLLESIE